MRLGAKINIKTASNEAQKLELPKDNRAKKKSLRILRPEPMHKRVNVTDVDEKEAEQEAKLTKLIQASNEVCKKAVKTIFSRKAALVDEDKMKVHQDNTPNA